MYTPSATRRRPGHSGHPGHPGHSGHSGRRSWRLSTAVRMLGVLACLLVASNAARADQSRDWMIGLADPGGKLNVTLVYPGVMFGYEHTTRIFGKANSLTLRGSALLTAAFNDVRADAELRILILTLGVSAGYRDNWRAQLFRDGEPYDRAARRTRDNTSSFVGELANHGVEDWAYLEGRAALALPFNDWLVYKGTTTVLLEARPKRSLDWRNAVVRDSGALLRLDHFLLGHHRRFGGFGPLMQVLSYELGGQRTTQLNYGFMFVGRPGFRRDHDLILFQMLFHFGDALGGADNRDYWGAHNLYTSGNTLVTNTAVPYNFVLAYRMVFGL